MPTDEAQARTALAHLSALRGNIDELLQKGVSWDGVSREFVEEVIARSRPLFSMLLSAAPELYAPFEYRYHTAWAPANNKEVLLSVRRNINYVLEVGAQSGLCSPASVVPEPLSPPVAPARSWFAKHAREIVIGLIVTVVGGAIIFALGMN